MGEHFKKRGIVLQKDDTRWDRLGPDAQELYTSEAIAIITTFFDDLEYKKLRTEAMSTIHNLVNTQEVSAEALLHLREFLALSGGML